VTDTTSFVGKWKNAWGSRRFRIQWLSALAVLLCIALIIPHFFNYIQQRDGKVLHDPLLNLIPPHDLSIFTFSFIYGSILISIIVLAFSPQLLLIFLQAYCLTTILRMISIFLFPLNNPEGLIVLRDPFVNMIGYDGRVITKDLFFSGHVSTLFLLFLVVPNKTMRIVLLIVTIIVATLILVQHVHYTIDVVLAPVFSWLSVKIVRTVFRQRIDY
jgi:hypothetical protein